MSDLMYSGIIVGLLAMLIWTPFLMVKGILKMSDSWSFGSGVIAFIPIVNLIYAEVKYYGKVGLRLFATLFMIVSIAARVFIWFNYYENVTLGLISMALFWGSILFYFISNMMFVYTVINDSGTVHGLKLVLYTIGYPFGQFFIGQYLNNVIRNMKEQEDTFSA